ncbi:SirB2 family protein [Sansalvadorimonas sp. 2012CJ34-2]|uniref:SirB2 family protein n=1 Tax=Parendozoicomonas callyspongiae TaxID=2942213 RepID=A0ABT0PEW5_9GAMM|nr:SirB2 family protein [Sansalvadorimonas sp. 2012CJ34-2]MCL6269317.1 SirB2 family protein [Sansalvadorimonas sp. 2012CJ34-2]
MIYFALKHLHTAFAATSMVLFFIRWLIALINPRWLRYSVFRVVPHVIDTLLLLAAIGLCVFLSQYPFVHSWLTAKVVALVAYIVIGYTAVKGGKTFSQKFVAGMLALLIAGYIVGVAIYHNPYSWLS